MKNYGKLLVWRKSHQLVLDVYKIVNTYPKEEKYGLISQMKRSATSVPTNIAEGCGRKSEKEFCRFLVIALGSASELEYQVILSTDLTFINTDDSSRLLSQVAEVKKMLNSLISKLSLSASKSIL